MAGTAAPEPRAPRGPYRRTYAALDLGTNNCRLLIARPGAGDSFTVVDAFSRIVRLGEGLGASGRISDAAIERAIAALKICSDKLVRRGVHLSRAVATEACRRAENGPDFVARVYRETGILLDIIDPGEEARLAAGGCHLMLEPGDGPALIFDIGGGSTELVRVETKGDDLRIIDWTSIPWGVVSMSESEPHGDPDLDIRLSAYERMRARAATAMADFVDHRQVSNGAPLRLLGTSGTVTTLGSVHLNLTRYSRDLVDGLRLTDEECRTISRRLAEMTMEQRAQVACIGRERADLVVAGCAILEAILDLWPAPRVGVADRGIREGILRNLMANER